jgi:hypothetical protein
MSKPVPRPCGYCTKEFLPKRNRQAKFCSGYCRNTFNRESVEGNKKHRIRYLGANFGLSIQQWQSIFDRQGGVCFLCKRTQRDKSFLRTDHCHLRKSVRGLLCNTCNRVLGLISDDISLLEKMIEYIRNPPEDIPIIERSKEEWKAFWKEERKKSK